jgi:hypothetical protein
MQPPRPERTGVDDRRGDARRTSLARLSIHVESPSFGGQAENLSQAGVFFFSPDRVRVQVEIEEGGQRRVRGGTLVRVERMSADLTGYAIEFDRG